MLMTKISLKHAFKKVKICNYFIFVIKLLNMSIFQQINEKRVNVNLKKNIYT